MTTITADDALREEQRHADHLAEVLELVTHYLRWDTFTPPAHIKPVIERAERAAKQHRCRRDTPDDCIPIGLTRGGDFVARSMLQAGVNLELADLRGADLSNTDLFESGFYRANLTKADASKACLSHADLFEADLLQANLTGATLTSADLRRTTLYKANLTNADLTDAKLQEADLRYANLTGTNFTGADLAGTALYGAIYDTTTIWPAGFTPPDSARFIGLTHD